MDANLGQNLRRLRTARKLTQAQLAERAGLSRVAYGNLESGAARPRVETLLRLAEVLETKLPELLAPSRELKAVRFRALKRLASREQVLADVARWLESYTELEELVGERIPYRLERLARELGKLPPGSDRARLAAGRARAALQLAPDAGIRDICGLLEERGGIKVLALPVASDALFGLSVARSDGGPAIVVNTWDRISVERWIFTAAHELGHLLLHFSAFDRSQTAEDRAEEAEANQFASHFLLPEPLFRREWAEARGLPLVDRVLKVKRIFRVSYRTVLFRLAEDPSYGKTIWPKFQRAHLARTGASLRKTDEPAAVPPVDFHAAMVAPRAAEEPKRLLADDFVEDRLRRLVRVALDQERITLSRAAELLDVDLATMRAHAAAWVE